MKIRDGEWELVSYDPKLKRQTWIRYNPDGSATTRTDYEVSDTIDLNTAQRNVAQHGWKGDYHHVASVPLNVYWSKLAEASRQDDQRYISKWLNDADNRAWRTKNGSV